MSYTYFFDILQYVEDRIKAVETTLTTGNATMAQRRYLEGQLAALQGFAAFFRTRFEENLPRRLHRHYMTQGTSDLNEGR
ncbi:MAG: hypothetical protein PVH87_11530 [Desulfobacteraceae bacterium]|jgi:hypothetical protein